MARIKWESVPFWRIQGVGGELNVTPIDEPPSGNPDESQVN